MLDDESPTSANLENDHEFINKEYYLDWYESRNPKQSQKNPVLPSKYYFLSNKKKKKIQFIYIFLKNISFK